MLACYCYNCQHLQSARKPPLPVRLSLAVDKLHRAYAHFIRQPSKEADDRACMMYASTGKATPVAGCKLRMKQRLALLWSLKFLITYQWKGRTLSSQLHIREGHLSCCLYWNFVSKLVVLNYLLSNNCQFSLWIRQ